MTLFLQKSVLLKESNLRAQLALPDLSVVTEDITAPEPSLSEWCLGCQCSDRLHQCVRALNVGSKVRDSCCGAE